MMSTSLGGSTTTTTSSMPVHASPARTSATGGSQLRVRVKPEDAAMYITVSDPVQHTDGLNKYTSYRVDVRPPNNNSLETSISNINNFSAVLRRYSDFLWLSEHLHYERAGAIVPPLPEKQPVGRFSPTFVEERRQQLERFLRRVAVHPELSDAACLQVFLRADDVTFQAAKQAKQPQQSPYQPQMNTHNGASMMAPMSASIAGVPGVAGSTSKKDGFKRWFAEAKTSMTGDLVKSPDDDLFDEIQRYVAGLDYQMRNVVQQASGLVRKSKEIANGLFEFGLAFNLLGQSEGDALGEALSKVGETADRLSVLSAEHADQEHLQFEDPLQDYIKTIHAVKLALQRRHEKRLTYSTCISSVEAKQAQVGKFRAQIGSEAKAYQAEMALRRAHEAAELARDDFSTVSQRVLREVDRFKREKAQEMRQTVLDYIQLQVEYNQRMEKMWGALIPQLERVQLNEDSSEPQNNTNMAAAANNNNNNNVGVTGVAQQTPPRMQVSSNNNNMTPTLQPLQAPLQQQQQQYGGLPQFSAPPQVVPTPTNDFGNPISVQYRNLPEGGF